MATGFCVSSLLCQVLKNEVWKMRKKMPGRFTSLCPFFKFDPSLCPFHHTILSFATSREKLSPIGNEKEGKVTANVFWARWQVWCVFKPSTLSIRAFERVSVLYMFCLRKPTPQGWDVGLHLPSRPWSKEKLQLAGTSCFGHKHCHAGRAFPLRVGKTTCPITLFQQPASLVANNNDNTIL